MREKIRSFLLRHHCVRRFLRNSPPSSSRDRLTAGTILVVSERTSVSCRLSSNVSIRSLRKTQSLVPAFLFGMLVAGSWHLPVASSELLAQEVPIEVYADGELPEDVRLKPLKDLNAYFPFKVPETKAAWDQRSRHLRRQVRIATGLWPHMPKRTPLNAVIHGKVVREGITVEKVYFESIPNHFVTGLLFRPNNGVASKSNGGSADSRRPAVLCPHGHGGRMQDYGAENMAKLIESGAEKYEKSGRFPKLARCAHLARMGCVCFIFDMLGYEDSQQISRDLAHKFREQRPEMEGADRWGFYSAQAELRLQSIMGLQTWNSIRCLDFLESLPDVDPNRIAVTGGSGGGTQTILLGAIDERPIAAFPNGMVSTSMQGGCTCENCSVLRLETGNVELAALFAPKPQAMTAANDWTKEMMTKGYPELRKLYAMLGAPDSVKCRDLTQFPHNYNYVSRETMYEWFNEHMELGLVSFEETDFEPLSQDEAAVWNADHPRPSGGEGYERSVTRYLADQSDKQLQALMPVDQASFGRFKDTLVTTYRTILARDLSSVGTVDREKVLKEEREHDYLFADKLRVEGHQEEFPVVSLYPKKVNWNGDVVLWFSGEGKQGLFRKGGAVRNPIKNLVEAGAAVMSADLFMQGEFLAGGDDSGEPQLQRRVENPREAACYSFCYNHTLFAQRVHDVLSLIEFVRKDEHAPERIMLVGVDGAGPIVALAKAIAGDAIAKTAIDTEGFRFAGIRHYLDVNLLPGAVKYGDVPVMLGLCAPQPLQLVGENSVPKWTQAAFDAAGVSRNIQQRKRINAKALLSRN